jgi:Zn-finger nucleic acid-binding protein
MFFQISPKKEIQSVELETCQRCNAVFAPKPQLEKIIQTVTDDYVHFCPRCRGINLSNVVHKLTPSFPQGSGAGLH